MPQVVQAVKNLSANAGDKTRRFDPWVGKIPQRRARQPTQVFLPGESYGQRNLATVLGVTDSDMTKVT